MRSIIAACLLLAFLTPQARAADCAAAVRALIVEHLGVEREKVVGRASIVDDLVRLANRKAKSGCR